MAATSTAARRYWIQRRRRKRHCRKRRGLSGFGRTHPRCSCCLHRARSSFPSGSHLAPWSPGENSPGWRYGQRIVDRFELAINRTRRLFTAFATPAVIGGLVGSPAALADDDPPPPPPAPTQGWAAIAYSPSTGKDEMVWDVPDQKTAVDDAVANCNGRASTTDCAGVVVSDGCVSMAAVPGDAGKFLGGWGTSLAEADGHALQGLPGGIVVDHQCNDYPAWGNGTIY